MKALVWCHQKGVFPLADFDEYNEVLKLVECDKNEYANLRLTGFDHSDALLAVKEAVWNEWLAEMEDKVSPEDLGYWKAAMV